VTSFNTRTGAVTLTSGDVTNALSAGSIVNSKLSNPAWNLTTGQGIGLTGSGTVALGNSITLTNTGVTAAIAGTGVTVSAATGNVTFSIGQSVATNATVQFGAVSTTTTIQATGNITGGNLATGGRVVATGNIETSGYIKTPNTTINNEVTTTGNVTGGNLVTGGRVIATGNITGGNVTATTFTGNVTGNVTGTASTATSLTAATSILAGSLTINPTNIVKNSASTQTFTLTGLTTSHKIIITSGTALTFGIVISAAWASALNTLSIEFQNATGGGVDLGNINIQYFAWV
jgi:hypothetical protein